MTGPGQLGRTRSVALSGLAGTVVEVEAHVGSGLPSFVVVGLGDTAIAQAPARVKAAGGMIGVSLSSLRVTVNLSPASVPKHGSVFDLPICVALLAARAILPPHLVADVCHLGELGLDGSLRPVNGVLPAVLAAAAAGVRRVVVPRANAAEAGLVDGVTVWSAGSLAELVQGYAAIASGSTWPSLPEPDPPAASDRPGAFTRSPDLAEVAGQYLARSALEVAAAGGHHLLLNGPPGAGKTMLAERIVTVLPPLSEAEALEVLAVESLVGAPGRLRGLSTTPPFVAPHHSATEAALIGGVGIGGVIRPGAVSRAHRGVLFLDEAGEFQQRALQALRQPVESGRVVVARARATAELPARFQLVLATNPCPCGRGWGDGAGCTCSPPALRRYRTKLSGPLVDRVDVQVLVPPAGRLALSAEPGEASAVVRGRVVAARAIQRQRWSPLGWSTNAQTPGSVLRRRPFRLPAAARADADRGLDLGALTLRGYDRVLRVAWTLADLGGRDVPGPDEVAIALGFRAMERAA